MNAKKFGINIIRRIDAKITGRKEKAGKQQWNSERTKQNFEWTDDEKVWKNKRKWCSDRGEQQENYADWENIES